LSLLRQSRCPPASIGACRRNIVIETLLAAFTLAVCVVLFVRLLLGAPRQRRFDAAVRRAFDACRRTAWSVWHWRRVRKAATRTADEAIRRARGGTQWDGNVAKPKSFRRPRKPH
jgi:hypothetical protein